MSQINQTSAQASAQVNGISSNWQNHAAAMLSGSNKAAGSACRLIIAAVNNAASQADTAALTWMHETATSNRPIAKQAAKRCIRCITAALYGRHDPEKAGYTVPANTPDFSSWTPDTVQAALKSIDWTERKGAVMSLWTGKAPVRFEKTVQQKTKDEKLQALAKAAARLMEKEGVTMDEIEKAIAAARAAK